MKDVDKLSILLIGHLTAHPSGSTLLYRQLVDNLKKKKAIKIRVINTARNSSLTKNWCINLIVASKVTIKVLFYLRKTQVVAFHASRAAMIAYVPILYCITKVFKKPLVLRLFGGALEAEYQAMSVFKRWLFDKTVLGADLFAVETKHLLKYFERNDSGNIRWFSNSTRIDDLPPVSTTGMKRCRRFIFLGIIKEEKGIDIILDAVERLAPEISIDLFGPLEGKYTPEYINVKGKGAVCYGGILSQAQVYKELFNYDALVLPTFYAGEGYPGVILEAYSHGLPVVATRWRSIPEIVDDTSGMLIPPHSAEALAQAMNRLYRDEKLYGRLCRGVLTKRREFSDEVWADRFAEWCAALVKHV